MKKITTEILKQKILTERDIKLLCKRANAKETEAETVDALQSFESAKLTVEQNKKGHDWLINQWKTPRGGERKNNPFGYDEENVLNTFLYITFDSLYNAGNPHINFYVPIYTVHGHEYSFQYVVTGGKITIIG